MKSSTSLIAVALAFAARGVTGEAFPHANGCSAQGQGSCNFVVEGVALDGKAEYTSWLQVAIYDYKCSVIGGRDVRPNYFHENEWYSEASQLPFTVDWHLYNGGINSLYMKYRSYSYGGEFACHINSDNWHICAHAFPC